MKIRNIFLLVTIICEVLIPPKSCSQKTADSSVPSANPGLYLLPVPQQAVFPGKNFPLNNNWIIELEGNIPMDDPAVQSLSAGLKEHVSLAIKFETLHETKSSQQHVIRLNLISGSVPIYNTIDTNRATLIKQAYRLKLNASGIEIFANAPDGLFYGVQTLLQLLRTENGQVHLPEGEIIDWPDLELRMIYWDCAHHLERLETFKRVIRQAAYFKINAIALKLEGHFQFKSAGSIVEPYALTPAEYQELTDYAKAHFIQLIPYLDAPAHVSFILKHPEYNGLRAIPNSNYEMSVTNPRANMLVTEMFENLIEANRGSQYIFLSTDEPYYVGKAENEKEQAKGSGGNGKLLAQFISGISEKLYEKGRKVIFWGEYPLTSSDINSLPSHLINGEYNENWASEYTKRGIRQLIYTSTQGEEPLFPEYYPSTNESGLPLKDTTMITNNDQQDQNALKGQVGEVLKTIYTSVAGGKSDLMGVIVAAWGDSGLHPETFWLGYTAGTAAGWNVKPKSAQELISRFYISFYGSGIFCIDRIYRLMCNQAEFWNKSWDWETSGLRTPILGNSEGIFDNPRPAKDQTLPVLPVPSAQNLTLEKVWEIDNSRRLQAAEYLLKENKELIDLINDNIKGAVYQRYNLQVMRSIALLCRQNLDMLLDLQSINKVLILTSKVALTDPSSAISLLDQALDMVKIIMDQRNESLRSLTTLWYQDWYPRVSEANGRKYLDQVDDIKDHLPGRTVDMSYLIYRELHYPLGKWAEEVQHVRNQFAEEHHLQLRTDVFDWEKY
jgi:hypothetical protein